MRAETVKRLAILIAVLSVVGGTGYFAHGFQLDRNARSRIKKAELAEKEGELCQGRETLPGVPGGFSRGCRRKYQVRWCAFEGG